MATASEGCERLAMALNAVAEKRCPGQVRAVATPYYVNDAAVFTAHRDNWDAIFDYLDHVLDCVDPDLGSVRVQSEHGSIGFAVVPLTEDAAFALAAELEKYG